MKKMYLTLGAAFVFGAVVWAVNYPYSCSQSANCDSSCDQPVVFCSIASTLPYETECKYVIDDGKSIKCNVVIKGTDTIVSSSGIVKCTGCDSGSMGDGCEPGSGAWWVGCDPFAY